MRLDHVIATVPDLASSHRRLLDAGFAEAWPPGPFWPNAITSGIALGGINLEFIQPDADTSFTTIETLVLAPESVEEGQAYLEGLGLAFEIREKIEPDARLLALRGFPPEMTTQPQMICVNLYPENPPYPFFLCVYAPFLKERLSPAKFSLPHGALAGLKLTSPAPERVIELFTNQIGQLGLDVVRGEANSILEIRMSDGYLLTSESLSGL